MALSGTTFNTGVSNLWMVVSLLFLIAAVSFAANSPSAADIVEKSASITQQDWKEAPNYAFTDREIEGKRGHIQPAKTNEVLMIDGSPYNELIAVNDVPLSKQQLAIQSRKLDLEIHKRRNESDAARQQRVARYVRERNQDHRMLTEMVDAFDYKLVGEDMLAGRKVWVLKATPKPGYVPKNREGKILRGMQGEMWIDEATYQWVKVQADVVTPVSMYGFIAKVKPGTRFELRQEPVRAGLWLPKEFSVQVKATALGIRNENSREDDVYRAYQPMSRAMAQLTTAPSSLEQLWNNASERSITLALICGATRPRWAASPQKRIWNTMAACCGRGCQSRGTDEFAPANIVLSARVQRPFLAALGQSSPTPASRRAGSASDSPCPSPSSTATRDRAPMARPPKPSARDAPGLPRLRSPATDDDPLVVEFTVRAEFRHENVIAVLERRGQRSACTCIPYARGVVLRCRDDLRPVRAEGGV